MSVTIEFLGVSAIGGGRQRLELPVSEPTSAREVLGLANERLGETISPEQLEGKCMVLVAGQSILYLQGWDTVVQQGDRVSVVPLLGGG